MGAFDAQAPADSNVERERQGKTCATFTDASESYMSWRDQGRDLGRVEDHVYNVVPQSRQNHIGLAKRRVDYKQDSKRVALRIGPSKRAGCLRRNGRQKEWASETIPMFVAPDKATPASVAQGAHKRNTDADRQACKKGPQNAHANIRNAGGSPTTSTA